jgi:hypothetical protein
VTQFLENPETIAETTPTTTADSKTIYLEIDRRNIALKVTTNHPRLSRRIKCVVNRYGTLREEKTIIN